MKRYQSGFGLVELMIALVLGLVVIGGALNIFLTNQQAFKTNESLGRLQENARISFELMAREIRQAGGNPCGAGLITSVLNDSTQWAFNWDSGVIQGFTGSATGIVDTGTAIGERVTNTDAIRVLSGGVNDGVTIVSHDAGTSSLTLNRSDHGFVDDSIVVICDSTSAAIANLSSAANGNPIVTHTSGVGPTENCSNGLAAPIDCTNPTAPSNFRTFESPGFVSRLSASTWYIGNNSRNGRSLYRIGAAGQPEEIAEGVSQMELRYLLKDQASGLLAGNWVDAATVDASAISPWRNDANNQVVAVRVKLTLQTIESVSTNQTPLTRELIHVVNLRNRSLQ